LRSSCVSVCVRSLIVLLWLSPTIAFTASAHAATAGGITVSAPASGSTEASPVHFVASATAQTGRTITRLRIYIDNVKTYDVRASTLNTQLALDTGSHFAVVQAWDSAGKVYKKALSLTISNSGPNPSGAEYYVAPGGSDSSAGTASAPWATITHAAKLVKPGATVHVASGTYRAVTTSISGTASSRIRFISDVKWGAKIRTSGVESMWNNTANYVDIVGFDISGDGRLGILNTASFVRIMSNNVHNIPGDCSSSGGAGIDNAEFTASDDDVIGNVVHDIGNPAVQCYSVQGIYHSNLRGHILNNISYRNAAWGIHLWHAPSNVVVANNLVFQNGEGGIVVGAGDAPGGVTATGIIVTNNIVMENNSSWGAGLAIYETGLTGTSNRYINNLIWSNTQGIVLQNGLVAQGTINASPLLVNYQPNGSGDYHLTSGSRAINAATATDAPSNDLDGAPRPFGSGPDIGPYEFGSAPAAWPWQ
jgi:Protein of unknown function (DUF1565)